MKTELSSLDLHFIIKEMAILVGGKVDQIYQREKEEFIFQIHVPSKGRQLLRVLPGSLMYLASEKTPMPQKPPGFCVYMRKYLKNARIRKISQKGFERIVEIDLESKNQNYKLIFELFSKGNVIVSSEDYTIYSMMEYQIWSGRTIKPKETYVFPSRDVNFLTIDKEGLNKVLSSSDRKSIVKSLAMDLGLGGVYSEEVCLRAGIDKDLSPNNAGEELISLLFTALCNVRDTSLSPLQLYKGEKLIEILPFPLKSLEGEAKEFESFNEAIDDFLTEHDSKKAHESTVIESSKSLNKFDKIVKEQENRANGLERSAGENQRKGEVLFENYQEVTQLLEKIVELRKKLSWAEVSEALKDDKLVKKIDGKTGELTIEVGK